MARPLSLQVYVTIELGDRVRKRAAEAQLSVSTWLRLAIVEACEEGGSLAPPSAELARIARQSTFVMVGVDALLAGHPDPALRERAHQAFARKCRQLGLPALNEEGA